MAFTCMLIVAIMFENSKRLGKKMEVHICYYNLIMLYVQYDLATLIMCVCAIHFNELHSRAVIQVKQTQNTGFDNFYHIQTGSG